MKTLTVETESGPVKVRTRPISDKEQRSPRHYWVQIHWLNGSIENRRMFKTWDGVTLYVDCLMSQNREQIEIVFLIDGNLSESVLGFVPQQGIWNRWEAQPFTDCGKESVVIDVARQLRGWAKRSAARL